MKSKRTFLAGAAGREGSARLLLAAALLLGSLFIFRDYVFGNSLMVFDDIAGDTKQLYAMQLTSVVNHLRAGNFSWWDFTNGFGINEFALNLFDPSQMLLILWGVLAGPAHMLSAVVWMEILRILLAGLVFYAFLSQFSFGIQAKFAAAFAYGFNGYLLIWGQHFSFGMVAVYFPLLLWCCERYLMSKKGRAFLPVVVCLCGIYSVYFTYMCLLGAGFYLLLRIFMQEGMSFWKRIKKLIGGALLMLLGLGMSFAVFLPTAGVLLNVTSRVGTQGKSLKELLKWCFFPYVHDYYEMLGIRIFSSNLQNLQDLGETVYKGYENYFEDPALFCSTLAVFLDVQLLGLYWKEKKTLREKIVVYLGCCLLLMILILPVGAIAFAAFSNVTYRFTFIVIAMELLGMAYMWQRIVDGGRISVILLIVVYLFMNHAYKLGYEQSIFSEYRHNAAILAVTGEIMVVCLAGTRFIKSIQARKALMAVLLVMVMVNVISEGSTGYQDRQVVRKNDTALEDWDLQKQEEARLLQDPDMEQREWAVFVRPQDYFRQLYSPDIQEALVYLEETDPEFYRVEKNFMSATISMDSQAQNYRGISTYNSILNSHIKEFVDTCWPDLYKYDQNRLVFSESAGENELAAFAGVRYLLCREPLEQEDGYTLLAQFGEIYVYKNTAEANTAWFYPEDRAISEDSLKNLVTKENRAELLTGAIALEGGVEIEDAEQITQITEPEEEPSEAVLTIPDRDSRIEGSVNAAENGYLLFMIPFEDGWKLEIDGEETELMRGNLGFLACRVEQGSHAITLTFCPPYLKAGIAGSLVCWAIFGMVGLAFHLSGNNAKGKSGTVRK